MQRRTVIVEGPLAFRMRRLAAARNKEIGLQIMTLPLVAAHLAGGFIRPAGPEHLEPAIRVAIEEGGFAELEQIRRLPGMIRALLSTVGKVWEADIDLTELANKSNRTADLALIETRVHAALQPGVLTPRKLRDAALTNSSRAAAAFGSVELQGVTTMAPVWRPLIDALAETVELSWCEPEPGAPEWFRGKIIEQIHSAPPSPQLVSCANPHAEVVEALRWVRELLASGQARPEEIAIAAASPHSWDEHFLVLADTAELPVHFSHGVPALSTREGQACAALADILLNGISQDRVRRFLGHVRGIGPLVKNLPAYWAVGLAPGAGLFEVEHWHRAMAGAALSRPEGIDPTPILLPVIELLAEGIGAADKAGKALLGPSAHRLWIEALRRAPADAIEFSLYELRLPDQCDPGVSVVWCPASHLAASPRPWVRLLGLTNRNWPRATAEDPLLPDHILAHRVLDPDPIPARDSRAFQLITARASGACFISRSRRDAQGKPIAPSPLLRRFGSALALRRDRTPAHAFSEADRLAARPQEAAALPAVAAALRCWVDWRKPTVTSHDGRVRAGHPVIRRTLERTQSATSLRLLLRDPLGFVWRYGLGWQSVDQDEQPLDLDPRVFGELVHELLKRAVDALEPDPGYGRAAPHEVEDALTAALAAVSSEWPLTRSTPPLLLWQHTLDAAAGLARKALTFDAAFRPGTRSWTEVRFGEAAAEFHRDLPWGPQSLVRIPGTDICLRGAIDRLDLRAARDAVQVSDYKTGTEPKNAEQIVFQRGAELQRVIYALAVQQLLPDIPRIVARLVFLGSEPKPRAYRLVDVDGAIAEIAAHVKASSASLDQGLALPGPGAQEGWNEFRLALPAGLGTYFEITKRQAFSQALSSVSRIWSSR